MTLRGAWLLLLEDFRGDLGDVTGRPVGEVAGHLAFLYAVNDGTLVQWSDEGRWYGLFSRNMPADEVVNLARRLVLLDAAIDTAGS